MFYYLDGTVAEILPYLAVIDCGGVGYASKPTNTTLAKPGMIFSIEPGVYLPGEFGVRVEDLVLVTEDGCEILNHVDKHWKTVG